MNIYNIKNIYHCSCAPSWTRPEDRGYNCFLFTLGFFVPVSIIISSSVSIITTIERVSEVNKYFILHTNIFVAPSILNWVLSGLIAYQSSRTSKENIEETSKGFLHGKHVFCRKLIHIRVTSTIQTSQYFCSLMNLFLLFTQSIELKGSQ